MKHSGPQNSITDVPGVHLGHLALTDGEIQTGVTAILPYSLHVRNRKLFVGSYASGGWNEWTGLHVAQDFGTFSSPIVICNATTVGIAYDALISFGHQREEGLPIDNAWPPVVIGMDDGYLNDLRQRRLTHDHILDTIHSAKNQAGGNGCVGIGRGLCAFGGKGGVGEASSIVHLEGADFVIGVFVAANGGESLNPNAGAVVKNVTPSFIIVLATDAPLLPEQLRRVAEAGLRGLDRFGLAEASDQQLALAFSTGNTIDNAFDNSYQLFKARRFSDDLLAPLCAAAADASPAALLNGLRAATTVTGRKGRTAHPVEIKTEER
ncbi:MAG: P1 family peptidase [bacterium]